MSSLGYAQRLSRKEDVGGTLGSEEIFFESEEVEKLAKQLAMMIEDAGKILGEDEELEESLSTRALASARPLGSLIFEGRKGFGRSRKLGKSYRRRRYPFL